MKLLKTVRLTGALLAGVLLSAFFTTANAAGVGTAAGTTIANSALASYTVGTTVQYSICSSPTGNSISTGSTTTNVNTACAAGTGTGTGAGTATSFKVDTKLLITVVANDTADVTVNPGTSGVLTFTVSNQGNAPQGVSFTTIQEISGTATTWTGSTFTGPSDFALTAPSVAVFVENGTTVGYQVAQDTATNIPTLASGSSATVYIVSAIPSTQLDGDIAVEALVAQETVNNAPGTAITSDNSTAAWDPTTSQLIFADAASTEGDTGTDANHDGKSSARDVYMVQSAKLTITKTQVVLGDPTGDATPHAIPGAVIKYTVTVANAVGATQPASAIALADALPANTNWGGNTGVSGTTGVGTLNYQSPSVNGGALLSCPDGSATTKTATSPYTSVTCGYTAVGTTVNISGVYLKAGDTATVTYTVTVQ
jgi:uncharacterized repeat protein (TIGR01451 family)